MTAKIGLNFQPGAEPATDDHRGDVRGPGAADVIELMMRRKFIGKTAGKIVRLTDVYRVPPAVAGLPAEDVDAAYGVKPRADGVVLKFVSPTAFATPDKGV
jgi:hypothetical protein